MGLHTYTTHARIYTRFFLQYTQCNSRFQKEPANNVCISVENGQTSTGSGIEIASFVNRK